MTRDDFLKDIPFAPAWIANPPKHLVKGGQKRGNLEIALTHPADEASSRARAVLDKLSNDLASETTGGRNDALNKAAFTMGGFVAAGAISRAEVEASLTNASHRNGLAKDDGMTAVEKTIASGLQSGVAHPFSLDDTATTGDNAAEIGLTSPAPKAEVTLSELTHPPGLVGKIVDWIEASAMYPSRELALSAAIGFVATIAGRAFEGTGGARTNFYMAALAPSGYGKDHAPSCINSLAMKAGLDRFIGPARFMSASAVREVLMRSPSVLCIQDEFGGILRQIDGPNVGIHNAMIRTDLLGLFSRAKDFYAGAAYANLKEVKLFNPNLSILGLSTPSDFWSAVTSARGSDGFLPRFLLFNIDAPKAKRVKPMASVGQPPEDLIKAVQSLYTAVYSSGNLVGALATGANMFPAKPVNCTEDAGRLFDAFDVRVSNALEHGDEKRAPFLGRAMEHAAKLALTIAVGDNPHNPTIEAAHMQWAIDLAWVSTCAMIQEAESKIADNDRQRIFNLIYDHVRKAGQEGIPEGRLRDRLAGTVRKSDWNEVTEELRFTGRVLLMDFKPKTGRPSKRYVAREFAVANDNVRIEDRSAQASP